MDTSSSVGKDGFAQMKEMFSIIIDGIYVNSGFSKQRIQSHNEFGNDNYSCLKANVLEYATHDIKENVAVIVCGRHTKFLRHYSSHYEDIKHSLGR